MNGKDLEKALLWEAPHIGEKAPEQIPELDLERYHVLQVDLYRDQPDYDHDVMLRLKRNCNYYLLAEHDAAGSGNSVLR